MCLIQILVTILTVLAAGYTIYLGIQKTGMKVKASFSVDLERSYEPRISNIVLQNDKDLPVCIYRLFAIFDDNSYLEIKKFDSPLVLKPYEAVKIITDPYSRLRLGNEIHKPDLFSENTKIGLELLDKIHICDSKKYKESSLKDFKQIAKYTKYFNNIVYNERVKYILVYEIDGVSKTAFLSPSGVISEEWNLSYNKIGVKGNEINEEHISLFLEQKYSGIIKAYQIYLVDKNTLENELVKRHFPT